MGFDRLTIKTWSTRFLQSLSLIGLAWSMSALGAETEHQSHPIQSQYQESTMKIAIEINDQVITASMKSNSAAAQDFVALLPLTLTLTDYAATEKVSDLPQRLSTQGEPAGAAAKAGDLAYYAPWGNLAIFQKDFRHSSGLVILGHLDSGLNLMQQSGPIEVTIRSAE